VTTPSRHTISGAVAACLLAATTAFGTVQAAAETTAATSRELAAPDACPLGWPVLRAAPHSESYDGGVSVLVGGNLQVAGAAGGAEGTVVALGNATFAHDLPGSYEVGATLLGSQVTPFAGSDMLVVGGNLATAPGTHLDVGQGLGGDVVVGGTAAGVDLDGNGGTVDEGIADATAPYVGLASQLGPMSAAYAALPPTGTVEVTDGAITLTGDGLATTQVFQVDGATLGATGPLGRGLQLVGVPAGATVVVNLTGPVVDLDVDALLAADGTVVDPLVDASFADLATHLLWNAPAAGSVSIGGLGQLPGSLLVPSAPSTTTLSGVGTNGRILVGGDLVHTGLGELHAYPFLPNPQLACSPDPVHLTTVSLDVELVDPDHVVDRNRYFEGRFECTLAGLDVTPADNTWKLRASAEPRVLSDQVPAGASCTVTERLDSPPAPLRSWAAPSFTPELVVVAKRRDLGITVTNRVRELPPVAQPTSTPTPTPTAAPTDPSTETTSEPPAPAPAPTQTPSAGPVVEPTDIPPLPTPSTLPTPGPQPSSQATDDAEAPQADAPRETGTAAPLIATTPLNLRGAFVWGPLLMLSLLTLLLRVRRRPKRLRLH
jgi:choice-of-anchor A domain-containing protein